MSELRIESDRVEKMVCPDVANPVANSSSRCANPRAMSDATGHPDGYVFVLAGQ